MAFQDFNLPSTLTRALQALRFETPTPIQAEAIPVALLRRDLIGCAQTGTGKTAAFAIPLLVRLLKTQGTTGLILAPTRELAKQIETTWRDLSRFNPEIRSAVLIGGMAMQPQIRDLRRAPRLIIATPGRLMDHLDRGSVSLSKTEILVLDEADRMLDMGFAPQLKMILRFLPKTRQTLLFSATWSPLMDQLSSQYLKDPVRITVGGSNKVAAKIEQSIISTTHLKKNDTLLDQINQSQGSVLVFARTKSRTDRVAKFLTSYGLPVNRIHGGRTQGQRNSALEGFRSGKTRILVATDIAARGIDVSHVAHVINYDLPQQPEDYVHRIGRTARAGASGQAVSFLTPEDRGQWRQIAQFLKKSGSTLPELR